MADRVLPQDEITLESLRLLTTSGITEGQTIEFKRAIDVSSSEKKRNLSAEVASFANASGGDIVFGMTEEKGRATALTGIVNLNADQTELQLRQIFNSNLDPVVPGLRFVPVALEGKTAAALVVRIPRSWNRPHVVLGDVINSRLGRAIGAGCSQFESCARHLVSRPRWLSE